VYGKKFDTLLERLRKDFDLKENHITILDTLFSKDMTADEICKKTGIPKGRIYEFLNYLVDVDLVSKIRAVPAKYTVANFEKRIMDFLNFNFDNYLKKEMEIIDAMSDGKRIESIKMVKTREEHILQIRRSYISDKEFMIIERKNTVPFFFFPENDQDFRRIRSEISRRRPVLHRTDQHLIMYKNTFFSTLKTSRKSFRYLVNQTAINNYFDAYLAAFDKKKMQSQLQIITDIMKEKDVKVRVTKDIFPYHMFLTDKRLMLSLNLPESISGMLVESKGVINEYAGFFRMMFSSAKPVEPILAKLKGR
jgi:sugar-specific transcriptional regulator TrmB